VGGHAEQLELTAPLEPDCRYFAGPQRTAKEARANKRSVSASQIFRDCSKLFDGLARTLAFFGMDQAMIDMVIDEGALGASDSILDCLKLLGNVDARLLGLDHFDDASQMTASAAQALDDGGMAGVGDVTH